MGICDIRCPPPDCLCPWRVTSTQATNLMLLALMLYQYDMAAKTILASSATSTRVIFCFPTFDFWAIWRDPSMFKKSAGALAAASAPAFKTSRWGTDEDALLGRNSQGSMSCYDAQIRLGIISIWWAGDHTHMFVHLKYSKHPWLAASTIWVASSPNESFRGPSLYNWNALTWSDHIHFVWWSHWKETDRSSSIILNYHHQSSVKMNHPSTCQHCLLV